MPKQMKKKEKTKNVVLDASAIYNGILSQDLKGKKYLPLCVIEEIMGDFRGEAFLAEIKQDRSIIQTSPKKDFVTKAKKQAEKTGDIVELSSCDLEVLATALELYTEESSVELISDDYDIQNLAEFLKIPYRGIYWKGISSVHQYYWKCTGCGITSSKPQDECIECGSKMVKKVYRKQK